MVTLLENIDNYFEYNINVNLTYDFVYEHNKNYCVNENCILTDKDFEYKAYIDNNGKVAVENYNRMINRVDDKVRRLLSNAINLVITDTNYKSMHYVLGKSYKSGKNEANPTKISWSRYFEIVSKLLNNYELTDFETKLFTFRIRTSNHLTNKEKNDICDKNNVTISSIYITNKDLQDVVQQINRIVTVHSNLLKYVLNSSQPINNVNDIPNKYLKDINKYKIQ